MLSLEKLNSIEACVMKQQRAMAPRALNVWGCSCSKIIHVAAQRGSYLDYRFIPINPLTKITLNGIISKYIHFKL